VHCVTHAGLRVGEVANLTIDDVELNERSGKLIVRMGKGGKYRRVPLNSTARSALRSYLEIRPHFSDLPGIFISQKGGAMTSRAIGRVVQMCVREAGLENDGITPHSLRHTFATNYLEQNPGQLVELAALLGHADLNTTAIYVQSSFDAVAQRMERSPLNVNG
jgi:site-specific recombinase XerD